MVDKDKAIELIDKKIAQFENIKEPRDRDNLYDNFYTQIYHGAEALIEQLFSKEKVVEFRSRLPIPFAVSGPRNYAAEVRSYKNQIETCIALLRAYREYMTLLGNFVRTSGQGKEKRVE